MKSYSAAYAARREARLRAGTWEYPVPVERIREHVRKVLAETGMTKRQFAEASGIHYKWTSEIMRSDSLKYVTGATARKVYSVSAGSEVTGKGVVPALGAVRRLRALAVAGWTARKVAEVAGLSEEQVCRIRLGKRDMIYRTTDAEIVRAYRQLMTWPARPPEDTATERFVAERTRRIALALGWIPGAAWDDFDDPNDKPSGMRRDI